MEGNERKQTKDKSRFLSWASRVNMMMLTQDFFLSPLSLVRSLYVVSFKTYFCDTITKGVVLKQQKQHYDTFTIRETGEYKGGSWCYGVAAVVAVKMQYNRKQNNYIFWGNHPFSRQSVWILVLCDFGRKERSKSDFTTANGSIGERQKKKKILSHNIAILVWNRKVFH